MKVSPSFHINLAKEGRSGIVEGRFGLLIICLLATLGKLHLTAKMPL
jgi:hypothetical protein